MRRGTSLILAASTGLALLAGCASNSTDAPSPDAPSGGASSAASASPSAPASEAEAQHLSVQALDTSLLGDVKTDERKGSDPTYKAQWYTVPAEALTEGLSTYVTETVDHWKQDGNTEGDLTVTPELTAAGTDVVGIRMTAHENAGASSATRYHTLWYDVQEGALAPASTLFTEDGLQKAFEGLLTQLREAPWADAGTLDELAQQKAARAFDSGLLDSLNFTSDGQLVAEIDDYAVGPGAAGAVEVTMDGATVAPLLSDLGKRARSAASSPAKPDFTIAPKTPDVDCAEAKCVALTFDDGPGPYTDHLLDILAKEDVKATFFVLGPNVESNPDVIKRMAKEGHQIGNHTWSHSQLTKVASDKITAEVNRTSDAVKRITGHAPRTVRPPYGAINKRVRSALGTVDNGEIILWSVDTLDWKTRDAAQTVAAVRKDTTPGGIILMHDIHKTTVDAVQESVQALKEQGYTLVTVDQLLESEKPEPGKVFTHLG